VTRQRRGPVIGGEFKPPGELLGNPVLGTPPGVAEPGKTVGRPVFGFTLPKGCPVRGSVVPVAGKPVRGSVGAFVGRPVRGSVGGGSVVLGSVPGVLGVGDADGKPVPGWVGDVIGSPVRESMVVGGKPVRGVVVCAPAVATIMPRMPTASVVRTHAFMTYLPSRQG